MKGTAMKHILIIMMLLLSWSVEVVAADLTDQQQITRLMKSTWEKPDSVLEVSPVTITGDYAIVGWVQGHHGGRALLRKKQAGEWRVVLCAGDALLDKALLKDAGLPASTATTLLKATIQAEAALTAEHRKLFSLFKTVAKM